jgi:glycerophosphoryl diester phosphodiesterase
MKEQYEEINRTIKEEIRKKGFLIAAHRGTHMGTFPENTINAYKASFAFHADMVEMDVIRNANGEYYCIHDGTERQNLDVKLNSRTMTTAQIQSLETRNYYGKKTGRCLDRFEDFLKAFKDTDALFNLDRCWDKGFEDFSYTGGALELIEKYGMLNRFLFKTSFNEKFMSDLEKSRIPVPYLAIVNSSERIRAAEKYDINLAGFELLFYSEDDEIISEKNIRYLREKDYIMLTGSEMIGPDWNVSARHNDDRAVLEGPHAAWDFFVKKGFNVILTDIPWYMYEYRTSLKG